MNQMRKRSLKAILGLGSRFSKSNPFKLQNRTAKSAKSAKKTDKIFAAFAGKDAAVAVDVGARKLSFSAPGAAPMEVAFKLSEFESALVEAGGWVEYAAAKY
mgnify:CR=1 FL=1